MEATNGQKVEKILDQASLDALIEAYESSTRAAEQPGDGEFSYADHLKRTTTHRVRIFENHSWVAVVVTDQSDQNDCPSITSSIDCFMPAFLSAHPEISPQRLVVIEHYDHRAVNAALRALGGTSLPEDEHFDLVSFGGEARLGRYCHPEWAAVTREEVQQWTGAPLA